MKAAMNMPVPRAPRLHPNTCGNPHDSFRYCGSTVTWHSIRCCNPVVSAPQPRASQKRRAMPRLTTFAILSANTIGSYGCNSFPNSFQILLSRPETWTTLIEPSAVFPFNCRDYPAFVASSPFCTAVFVSYFLTDLKLRRFNEGHQTQFAPNCLFVALDARQACAME